MNYKGYSKRCGRIKVVKTTGSDRKDAILLYSVFDADTIIQCIEKGEILDELKLIDIYNENHL